MAEGQEPDTAELRELAVSAGCRVVGEITQSREEDASYELGEGKVAELETLVRDTGAERVIVDGRLSPFQTFNLGVEMPSGVAVLDRFQVVLEAFRRRAVSRRAQLQVRLGELRYELPRIEAKVLLSDREPQPAFMQLDRFNEETESVIRDEISEIRDELSHHETKESKRQSSRRDDGVFQVGLAGYTGSGRSTVFQWLAEEMYVGQDADRPRDVETTVDVAESVLTTLEPTTRRMTHSSRELVVADTPGFLRDIPFWLRDSFALSYDAAYNADVVLTTIDMTDELSTIQDKLVLVQDILHKDSDAFQIPVFTKSDEVSAEKETEILSATEALAANPVVVSAHTDRGKAELLERIDSALPLMHKERLQLPLTDAAMSVVSWIHNNAEVNDESYSDDSVLVEFKAREKVVSQARSKASELVQN